MSIFAGENRPKASPSQTTTSNTLRSCSAAQQYRICIKGTALQCSHSLVRKYLNELQKRLTLPVPSFTLEHITTTFLHHLLTHQSIHSLQLHKSHCMPRPRPSHPTHHQAETSHRSAPMQIAAALAIAFDRLTCNTSILLVPSPNFSSMLCAQIRSPQSFTPLHTVITLSILLPLHRTPEHFHVNAPREHYVK